jgi:eukaryotic-like serine/threonine-protein kinase
MRPGQAAGGFAPGALLAERFRIVRFLGRGGMGDVYEAEDEEVQGRVALKTVRAEIAATPGALERFAREIHLARKVTHPNVCRIFDISHHGQGEERVTFLTMELLAGETLEARLKRDGPLRESEALPVVRQMVEGLAAAHRAGVVHRDFKPANVMLVPEEGGEVRPVVTDFGLAHGGEPAGGGLTLYGDILGTPSYMAPEQVTGGTVTPVTDVYALGVVLYEMVTGSVPFKGDTALSTAVKRIKEPPPPPHLQAPGLDPAWEAAILRCLAVEPRDRFGSVREAVAALEAPALGAAAPSTSTTRTGPALRLRQSHWVIAAGILVLAIVALLVVQRFRRPVDPHAGDLPAEISSGSLPANFGAKDFYQRGRDALAHYNAAQARDLLKQAVAAEPGFPLAHSALAEAWYRLGYLGKSADEAKQAFSALPARLSDAEQALVQARYWETLGRWDQAIERYRSLWAKDPHNLEYGLSLAKAQTQAGRGKEALDLLATLKGSSQDPRIDLEEADTAFHLGQLDRARAAAERAQKKAEPVSRSLTARALLIEGKVGRGQQDFSRALKAFSGANDIYIETGDLRGQAMVARARASLLYDQGNLPGAQEGFKEARNLYRKVQDHSGEATALNDLASILGEQGHFAEAAPQFEQAARVLRETGDHVGEAQALGNFGFALGNQGKLAEGIEHLQAALKMTQSLGNLVEQERQLENLGTLYQLQRDLGRARSTFEEAIQLADKLGNRAGSAASAEALGSVLASQGDLEGAYERHQTAMEIRTKLNDPGLAESRRGMAEVYLEQELPRQALPLAQKAAEAARGAPNAAEEAEDEALLARIHLALKDLPQARIALDRAEGLAAKSEDPSRRGSLALAAGCVLAAEGKTAEAIHRLEVAIADQQKAGQASLALELREALGEIEASHGDHAKGRAFLKAVEDEAHQHGMGLIAGKAAKALAGSG